MKEPKQKQLSSTGLTPVPRRVPAAAVQTEVGPALIQVIDVPSGGSGAVGARGGGNGIAGAVARRWWLVLLVALVVGGSGMIIAGRLVQPAYDAEAVVLYHTIAPVSAASGAAAMATDPGDVVATYIELLTKPEISLLAARSPDLQQALPWLKSMDLSNPAAQKEAVRKLRDACDAARVVGTELVKIHASKADPFVAAAVANAYADAFVQNCSDHVLGRDAVRQRKLKEQLELQDAFIKELVRKKSELNLAHGFDVRAARKTDAIAQINQYEKLKNDADIQCIAAEATLASFLKNKNNDSGLSAQLQLARKKRIDEEKAKDSLLQAAVAEQVVAYNAYMNELGSGKTEVHRDVVLARLRMRRSENAVLARETQIAAAIDAKVADEQKLMVASTVEQAQSKLTEARGEVAAYQKRLDSMDQEQRSLAIEQQKLDELNETIARTRKQYEELWTQLQGLSPERRLQGDAEILVADRADPPLVPTDDKRIKVQAASVVGGLFLGVLLALLVDRFDRRLRNPRDLERLLGAPMLGMIPRIEQLKRAKGDLARTLVAEEFRLIRTQLLFGQERSVVKTLCVTSPGPGDGKTSLAVNLAISLARAGRRVLLVDGDLRKPDIHRIFAVPESPGFSELIQRSADPSAAIRKTDVELLEVLPCGLLLGRPCELLSRPHTGELVSALGEMYDHVIFDSAPLLPVSDTHVLLALVDGVICNFDAQTDANTIRLTEDILSRSRANVVGSVVNQVSYRRSTVYYRSRYAYSSYYNRPAEGDEAGSRVPPSSSVPSQQESGGA